MIFVFPMLSAGIDAGMVETLTAKVNAWEDERGHAFLYDGVSVFYSSMTLFYMLIKSTSIFNTNARFHENCPGPSFIHA